MKDLANISKPKTYEADFPYIEIKDDIFINGLKDVKGHITFYYDISDTLFIEYELKGNMLCPDALSLEDIEIPFDLTEDSEVTFREYDDGYYIPDGLTLEELLVHIVSPEAPISVEKKGETMYYSGDGWTILSEEEYNKSSEDKIDPRLAKLLEYKEE